MKLYEQMSLKKQHQNGQSKHLITSIGSRGVPAGFEAQGLRAAGRMKRRPCTNMAGSLLELG